MANPCAHSLFVFLKCHPSFLSPRVILHFSSLPPRSFVFPPLHNIPSCLRLPLLLSAGANAAGKCSGPNTILFSSTTLFKKQLKSKLLGGWGGQGDTLRALSVRWSRDGLVQGDVGISAETGVCRAETPDTLHSSRIPCIISHLCLLLQCAGKELKAVVDTGSQHNLMSSACLDRLG